MERIVHEFANAEKALDSAIDETRAALLHVEAHQAANARLSESSDALRDGGARIAEALSSIAEDGVRLRASEARLLFENARLKRSSRNLRGSLDLLRDAGESLGRRAREARAVAEAADRAQTLIDDINACLGRGEPVEHLLREGRAMIDAAPGKKLRRMP